MGEVCLFDKFSFCKNQERCSRVHLKETFLVRECDYRKCDKRHPWPCRSLMLNRFCRFGSRCRFSHRLPYNVEEHNDKIRSRPMCQIATKKCFIEGLDSVLELIRFKEEGSNINKTKYFRLRLSYKVSSESWEKELSETWERPGRDLRETRERPKWGPRETWEIPDKDLNI